MGWRWRTGGITGTHNDWSPRYHRDSYASLYQRFFALTQQIDSHGTARGGIYQEVRVNTPYVLTGYMAFYGDDIGDTTVIGILDGVWNPALAYTTIYKRAIIGNSISPWTEFSLNIIPTKDVITIFTETRQDWLHGNAAGWYDGISLKPFPEPSKFSP